MMATYNLGSVYIYRERVIEREREMLFIATLLFSSVFYIYIIYIYIYRGKKFTASIGSVDSLYIYIT